VLLVRPLALIWFVLLGACFSDGGVGSISTSSTSSPEPTSGSSSGSSSGSTGESSSTGTSTSATGGSTGVTTTPPVCMPTPRFAMTPECVEGSTIASIEWADMYCATAFGAEWRWLDHHIQGGWDAGGEWIDDVGAGERGWIYIIDQNSECFSSPIVDVGNGQMSAYGVTWLRPVDSCAVACHPGDGLDPEVAHPHVGGCNPYAGDTPCYLCQRLICVMG